MDHGRSICYNLKAEVMERNERTSYLVSRLLYEPHVYRSLDDEFCDIYTVHRVLKEIETGERLCIGIFNGEEFCGCVHLTIRESVTEPHLMLKRKVSGVTATELSVDCYKRYCIDNGIELKPLYIEIADNNRAIRRVLRFCGFEDCGILSGEYFVFKGKKIPVRVFRKELD